MEPLIRLLQVIVKRKYCIQDKWLSISLISLWNGMIPFVVPE
jgi:hypothetical protein